jgi:hypothetical protein
MSRNTILSSEHYGMVKPRDIREKLRGKVDPELGAILVRLCEDIRETRMMVVEVSKSLDQFADVINSMMHISGAMKAAYEQRFGPLRPPQQGAGDTPNQRIQSIAGHGDVDGG